MSLYYDGMLDLTILCASLSSYPLFFFLFLKGFHGDLNETYPVGEINEESKGLIQTTRESLDAAIKLCRPGALFRDLGKAMSVISLPLSPLEAYICFYHKRTNRTSEWMCGCSYIHRPWGQQSFPLCPKCTTLR